MEPGKGCFVGGCVGTGVGAVVLGGFVGWENDKNEKMHMLGLELERASCIDWPRKTNHLPDLLETGLAKMLWADSSARGM